MPVNFINSLTNFNVSRKYVPTMKFGRFSVVNNTIATLNVANSNFNCDLQLRSDFHFSGANTKIREVGGYTNYLGYNRKYIDENGNYDAVLALEEFSRSAPEKRVVKADVMALIQSHSQRDSHEAFLYNMMVSYGKALLKKMNADKKDVLTIITPEFRNSHCQVNLFDSCGSLTEEVTLGLPYDGDEIDVPMWELRREDNYFKKPYVLHYNAAVLEQEAFYLCHIFGRKKNSSLNFDLDISGLDSSQLLLDPINGRGMLPATYNGIPWDKPETLWMWIIDYVRLNRLEQVFAPVVESFSSIATMPLWESAEACVWQFASKYLTIPTFSPTRARVRGNLDGEPFVVDPSAASFIYDDVVDPTSYLQTAAITNYYELYGMYTLLHNEGNSRDNWRDVYTSMVGDLGVLRGATCRAACVSVITGLEIGTTMHDGCFTSYEPATMSKVMGLSDCTIFDSPIQDIPINNIPAPVSGSLILGTLSGPYKTVQHLKGLQNLPIRYSMQQAYKAEEIVMIANAYRLFGNEITVENFRGGDRITPWATATQCVIAPESVGFLETREQRYEIVDSRHREGRHYVMPHILSLSQDDKPTLTIRKPTLSMTDYGTRTLEARPFMRSERLVHKAEFKVKATYVATKTKFIARPVMSVDREPGFRLAETDIPPRILEGTPINTMINQESTDVDAGDK